MQGEFKNKRFNKKGFTLNELIITVAITGILAGVAVPKIFGTVAYAKCSGAAVTLKTYDRYKGDFYDINGEVDSSIEDIGLQLSEDEFFKYYTNKDKGAESSNGNGNSNGNGKGQIKVTICHIPPGNPANAREITVGSPALEAHLANGSTMGECPERTLFAEAKVNIASDCAAGDGVAVTFSPDGSIVENTGEGNCLRYIQHAFPNLKS